jgi:hypothetical protein
MRKIEILERCFTYTKDDVMKLLNHLTLLEIAAIVPKIRTVMYMSI